MSLRRTTIYGYHQPTRCDAFAGGVGQEGLAGHAPSRSGVLVQILQEGLHTAPTAGDSRPRAVFQDRRSRHRRVPARSVRSPRHLGTEKSSAPHDPLPRPATAGKKGGLGGLLGSVFADAHDGGLIEEKPEVAVDSTGLD